MTGLKMIRPTSRAPYALRFVGEELTVGVPGTAAVDFRYRLSSHTFEAVVTQYDGRLWRWVGTEQTDVRTIDPVAMELVAETVIDKYLSA